MPTYLLVLFIICTLSPEPKDPPKNVTVSVIPEEVNRVMVTFNPPEEPNGHIIAYFVYVYEKDQLVKNVSLNITERNQNMLSAVIEGLKGGHSYSIQVKHTHLTHTDIQTAQTHTRLILFKFLNSFFSLSPSLIFLLSSIFL